MCILSTFVINIMRLTEGLKKGFIFCNTSGYRSYIVIGGGTCRSGYRKKVKMAFLIILYMSFFVKIKNQTHMVGYVCQFSSLRPV